MVKRFLRFLRYAFVGAGLLFLAAPVLALDVSIPGELGGSTTEKILAAVPVIQGLAALLAMVPSLWGKGQQTGPGSGWFKVMHRIASFPAPTVKQ